MFSELFLESTGRSRGSRPKPSKAAKINDMVKYIKDKNPRDVIKIYDDLKRDYIDETDYEALVQPGEFTSYQNDRDKKGLLKSVLNNLKKAMSKLNIDSSVHDCAKNYIADKDNYIKDEVIAVTLGKYKGKDIGYNSIRDYRDAESFCEKFDVAKGLINALKRLPEPLVCDFNNAGLSDIKYKKLKSGEFGAGHITHFTQEFEVTVYHYKMKETVKFNVESTETTVHQSYWN
jgi:hypothetical protein